MNPPLLEQYSLVLMDIKRTSSRNDARYSQNDSGRNPKPQSRRFKSPLRSLTGVASRVTSIVSALNVALGRKTTIVPGMSDRAFARFSKGEHQEEVMRWNALAHQYGGLRSGI